MSLTDKQIKKLELIRLATDGGGMYPGVPQDVVAGKIANGLYRQKLISTFQPHNPSHKDRWVITSAGRRELERLRSLK